MQFPGRDDMNTSSNPSGKRDTEMNQADNDQDMDEDVSSDMDEESVPELDEEDLEENDLTDEEADDIEWEEPPTEATRNS